MAHIKLDLPAAMSFIQMTHQYAREHSVSVPEAALAMMLAGVTLMSGGMNDLQLDEAYDYVKQLTAERRQPRRS